MDIPSRQSNTPNSNRGPLSLVDSVVEKPAAERAQTLWERLEVPTWILLVVTYGLFLGLTYYFHQFSPWVVLPLGAMVVCLHNSLMHEALHGHPTRNHLVNTLLVSPPLGLWMPYPIYRSSHLQHHAVDELTGQDDPETYYVSESVWERLGPVGQWAMWVNQTLLGRMLLGPILSCSIFWISELARLFRGNTENLKTWLIHGVLVAGLLWWVIQVCQIQFFDYILFFAYPGQALTMVRSYLEHQPAENAEHRTAIVEDPTGILGVLFLHNNLHVVHHDHPAMPWFLIPKYYTRYRDRVLAQNGHYYYPSYLNIWVKFGIRPKDHPRRNGMTRLGQVTG